MAIRVNGKELKDVILKTDQFELRILEFVPDHMKVNVKESTGHPFNFVPRFFDIAYPDKIVAAKDTGIVALGAGKTLEAVITFQEKLHIEPFVLMDLRYAKKKLGTISVD